MSKDKKKKDKKSGKKKDTLKSLAHNPLVADVVAAALVATAAALKDSKRARALASDVGDELTKLSKSSSQAGSAMWELALQIGRQSLEALTSDGAKGAGDMKDGKPSKSSTDVKRSKAVAGDGRKTKSRAKKSDT